MKRIYILSLLLSTVFFSCNKIKEVDFGKKANTINDSVQILAEVSSKYCYDDIAPIFRLYGNSEYKGFQVDSFKMKDVINIWFSVYYADYLSSHTSGYSTEKTRNINCYLKENQRDHSFDITYTISPKKIRTLKLISK